MILLIIGVGMLNFLLPAPLNSIMFLLIPTVDDKKATMSANFKFHYVSINSRSRNTIHRTLQSLNSIMFLLIPVQKHDEVKEYQL